MENYEKDFIRSLKMIIWENLIQKEEFNIPQDNKAKYELIEFYGNIFRSYLRIDSFPIKEIFKEKFNEELINYF